jgi:hypothetical protein
LEGKLSRLLIRNQELEEELERWRMKGDPDLGLVTSLGLSDALLTLLLVGGVVWRRHYGPTGPSYPVDRWVIKLNFRFYPEPSVCV